MLTADNITLSGHLEIKKQIHLRATKELDSDKKLKMNDCFVCFSSGSKDHVGKITFIEKDTSFYAGGFMGIIRTYSDKILPKFLYTVLNSDLYRQIIRDESGGDNIQNLSQSIALIKVPIPPIDVQKQIVEEISKVDTSVNISKSLIDNEISDIETIISRLVSTVCIKEYFDINTQTLNPTSCWKNEHFTYVDIDSVGKGDGCISFDKIILGKDAPSRARRVAQDRTVVVSTVRPYLKGFAYIENVPDKTIFSTGFALFKSKDEENYISKLLYYLFMFSDDLMKQMETAMPKAAYPSINKEDIDNFKIPLLAIDEQKRIVAQIEALELEITKARTLIENAASKKQAILDKYLQNEQQ